MLGIVPTRRITTSDGHYIEASLQHRFRIVSQDGSYEWKYVKDITIGDQLVLTDKPRRTHHSTPLDTDLHNYRTAAPADKEWCVPEVIDNSLGTLLGVLYGGGFCDGTSALNSQACRDFISHLRKMATAPGDGDRHEITGDDWSVRFDNKLLWPLLLKNGLIGRSGDQITVPRPILASNSAVQASFLRGLFETSGSVAGRCVTLTSSSVILVRQVQSILLSLGMRSRIYTDRGKTGVSRYTLRLKTIRDMIRFRGTVGFISYKNNVVLAGIKKSRRSRDDRYANQAAMAELYDAANAIDRRTGAAVLSHTRNGAVSRPYVKSLVRRHPQLASTTLGTLARNNLFTDTVTDIDESVSRTYDITEDSCNTYVANGFVSHNSVIVISTCVAGDTYINTTNGLQQIKDFDGGFTRYDDYAH
jgi:ribonucleoside-diphosphate reductase alpha chain